MDLSALLAMVHADPRDLAARAVYADALLEAGDPRGELIALQLARGRASAPPSRRELELIAAHHAAWFGSLAPAIEGRTRLEHGFLRAVVLRGNRSPMDRAALDHPEWRTVEELDATLIERHEALHHEVPALLERLPALETLGAGVSVLRAVRQSIRTHALSRLVFGSGATYLDSLFRLLDARTFPALRAIRVWSGILDDEQMLQLGARAGREVELEIVTGPQRPERVARLIDGLVTKVDAVVVRSNWGQARAALVGDRIAIELRDADPLAAPAFRAVLDELGPRRVVVRVAGQLDMPADASGALAAAGVAIERA